MLVAKNKTLLDLPWKATTSSVDRSMILHFIRVCLAATTGILEEPKISILSSPQTSEASVEKNGLMATWSNFSKPELLPIQSESDE